MIKFDFETGSNKEQHVLFCTICEICGEKVHMRPVVDEDLCIGCGACEEICPSVFQVVDDKSKVIDPDGCEFQDCCEAAEENCPVEAITLVEDA